MLTADERHDLTTEQIPDLVIRSAKVGDLEVSEGDMVAILPSDEDSADEAGLQFHGPGHVADAEGQDDAAQSAVQPLSPA